MSHTTLRWHHWQSASSTAQLTGSQPHQHRSYHHHHKQQLAQLQPWQQQRHPAVRVLLQSGQLHLAASKMLMLLVVLRLLTTAAKAHDRNRLVLAAASASM
jgi:hypothetical protein